MTTVLPITWTIWFRFCGCNVRMKWKPSDISALHRYIQKLKLNGVFVLEDYQKSVTGPVKWHILYHVAVSIVRNGALYLWCRFIRIFSYNLQSIVLQKVEMKNLCHEGIYCYSRLHDNISNAPRKRTKTIELNEIDQNLLRIPRKRTFQNEAASESSAHMTLTAAALNQMTYHTELSSTNIGMK